MSEVEVLGWIGAFVLGGCAGPQALKSWRDGHSEGLSLAFLFFWFVGEILMIVYNLEHLGNDVALSFNYGLSLFFLFFIVRYKVCPRKQATIISLVRRKAKKK